MSINHHDSHENYGTLTLCLLNKKFRILNVWHLVPEILNLCFVFQAQGKAALLQLPGWNLENLEVPPTLRFGLGLVGKVQCNHPTSTFVKNVDIYIAMGFLALTVLSGRYLI